MDPGCTEYEPDRWLAAACVRLRQPTITLKDLLARARAWWATQVPSFLYEYLVNPRISPSLPHGARERLRTGRRLKDGKAPRTKRREAGLTPSKLYPAPHSGSTLDAQQRAFAALMNALSARTGKPVPTTDQTLKLLDAWFTEYASTGGWPVLMACWARHVLRSHKSAGTRLRRAGLERYLGGFGKRWILQFHGLDPWSIALDPMRFAPEIADRMAVLRSDVIHMESAGVARYGLGAFLRYVSAAGGPDIVLDSEWNAVVSAGYVDTNVLTPAEYVALLDWLETKAGTDRFTTMRNKVITVLAYRLGPRWEELKTRQRRDIAITEDWNGARCGVLDIRVNEWFLGKTSGAPRRLPLEKFLTASEIELVARFLEWIDSRGAKPTSFLFADRERPGEMPGDLDSHDTVQRGMRVLSGDHSLVFHHFRHSAASFFFLRIFTDEIAEPTALDWIDSHETISGAAFESGGVSYASWVMGRRREHGARLHLLSRLLGHIDCAMGMYAYVHFADEILAKYRMRLAPPVPNAVQARIDGVKKNSVVQRAIRRRAAA
jgi:integrase